MLDLIVETIYYFKLSIILHSLFHYLVNKMSENCKTAGHNLLNSKATATNSYKHRYSNHIQIILTLERHTEQVSLSHGFSNVSIPMPLK